MNSILGQSPKAGIQKTTSKTAWRKSGAEVAAENISGKQFNRKQGYIDEVSFA